ncbi:ATP-binding protein [Sedimenticola sp.]|uniref:ATP-binding protein n=1 Tax=Sedimenticola sp. TaxID=1940285 RepID=UPI003D129124
MIRLFLPVYLLVIACALAVVFAIQPLTDVLLQERLHALYERATRGMFYLLNEDLRGVPHGEQAIYLDQYNRNHPGYPIIVLSKDEQLLDEEDWQALYSGKMRTVVVDGAHFHFRWIESSRLAVGFTFEDKEQEQRAQDGIQTFDLLMRYLRKFPKEHWPEELEQLNQHMGIPMKLVRLGELDLDQQNLQHLQRNEIVGTVTGNGVAHYYGPVPDSDWVISVGPLDPPITQFSFVSFVVLGIMAVLGLGLVVWSKPLWNSIRELKQTSTRLGNGEMEARANVSPRSALGDLGKQFNSMADRIQQLVKGHRDLTNAVSHELRTPIARMRFGMEMMATAEKEADRLRYREGLHADIDDLEALVDEILTYARFERNAPPEPFESVAFRPWFDQVMANARRFCGTVELSHRYDGVSPDIHLKIRPRTLRRALENVLRNACGFAEQTVAVQVQISVGKLSLMVDDDGPGIPEDKRVAVFEVFSRLDQNRKTGRHGHGLGLPITRRCMESMYGSVKLADAPGSGARVILEFPIFND